MNRWLALLYGIASYLVFVATMVYSVAFFGNLCVHRTIDAAPTIPIGQALLVNIAILVAFALQHSGMARPAFKRWLSKYLSPVVQRSTYVLASSLAMIGLMLLWQPIGWVVWSVEVSPAKEMILASYLVGWLAMCWATFLIDHYELFGLRQVWCAFRGVAPCRDPAFRTPAAYRFVRHPIYTGWLIILWAAPVMTISHLVIATGLTLYIVLGVRFEEDDLARRIPYYDQYRRKVPMLLPSWRKRLVTESREQG
jgi:protein-S-isoprenylcysteine O-methyltransferase Ste14